MSTDQIDDRDRVLLTRLQRDARESLDTLAEAISLSVPAVQRRIRRLRERGIIQGDSARVDLANAGFAMQFIIQVELERERSNHIDAFRAKAAADPLVQQCYYVTGESDFVLIAWTRDMDEYERLTRRLFFDDANIRRFRTSIVMGRAEPAMGVDLTMPPT